MKNVYVIDGEKISDLKSFLHEFAIAVKAPNEYFGNDLAQFDDCLFGGFGLDAPCVIVWKNSLISRQKLNSEMLLYYYEEQKRYAKEGLIREIEELRNAGVNPDDYGPFYQDVINNCDYLINKASKGELTLFEDIVFIISSVTERASNEAWIVELILE